MPISKIITTGILFMDLISYAKTFLGTPYRWGADGGGAFDCSGFIQEVLACEDLDPGGDQNAQMLFDHFMEKGNGSGIQKRSLLFFGKNKNAISHVAMAIGHSQMIEAAGGGREVNSDEDAIKAGAMVRVRPITSRSDLVAAVKIPERGNFSE